MTMSRFLILLAMVTMASRAASASLEDGTLTVTSMRPINRCGGPQTALIVVSIGAIDSRDSLLFFDITLSYDTSVFRPQSVLTQGTLASQMDFAGGAALNLLVPGEARIYAGSLLRPAAGNLPLYAFTGPVILPQACGTFMPFRMEYEPEFNSEFKKLYPNRVLSGIQFVTVPRQVATQGVQIDADSVIVADKDSVSTVVVTVHPEEMVGDTVTVLSEIDDGSVANFTDQMEVTPQDLRYTVVERTSDRTMIRFVSTGTPVTFTQHVHGRLAERITSVRVSATADTCSCTTPLLRDTAVIRVDRVIQTTVGSAVTDSGTDERDGTMIVAGRTVHIHGSHEYPRTVLIVDMLGRTLLRQTCRTGETTIDLDGLPRGPVMIIMTGRSVVRTNVMLN